MEIDNMVTVVSAVGLPCFLILVIVAGIWKAAPILLKEYKEEKKEDRECIKEVATVLGGRFDSVENSLSKINKKIDNIVNVIGKE